MNFLRDTAISRSRWIDFFNSNPFSSPFQSPGFYDILNSYRKNSAHVFAAEEENRLIALVVVTLQKEKGITGYFSRRAIIYGGPLVEISGKGTMALSLLLKGLHKFLAGKSIYCETRNSFDYSRFHDIFKAEKWEYEPRLNVQIHLPGKTPEEALSLMNYSRRREIRLTMEAGAVVQKAAHDQEVRALYEILHDLYVTKVKLPLPGFEYFRTLFLYPPGITFIVLYKGQVSGGAFCLYSPSDSIYTLYYAGLRDNKIFPATFAIYGVFDFAIKQGLTSIDLMGAGKPGVPYGVRDFKMEFGGDLVENGRYRKVMNPSLFLIGKTGIKLMQKIK